jgi:hypothetical protein
MVVKLSYLVWPALLGSINEMASVYYFSKLKPIYTCKILLAKISVTGGVLALAPWAA